MTTALEPSLRRNVVSLFAVQFASYVAPLVTLPWLTRVLGPVGFGRLTFCAAVTGYFVLFADFGFNFSATRQVALHSNDRAGRSKIFWNTMAAKGMLAGISLPLLIGLTLVIPRFSQERDLLLINYITVLATVITPTWYFQGTERQVVLSSITVSARAVSIPLVFCFVRTSQQLLGAALISSGMQLVGGLVCIGYLAKTKDIGQSQVSFRELMRALSEGWHLFLSTASVSLYSTSNTVILGFVSGSAAVGHYGAAEKMIQAAQGLLVPINQSAYPRISRLMQDSRDAAFSLIRKVLRIQGSVALTLSLLLFLGGPSLVRILYGSAFDETVGVLRWLSWLPVIVALSNVFGIHTMMSIGMNRTVSRILVSAGAFNVILLFALAKTFGASGAAASVVATEVLVTAAMMVVIRRHNLPVFRISRPA